jgi:hypothetical protein
MPLFNESLASIAEAVVTVKRALKAGVIEKEDYKGLNDYLAQRVKDFGIDKKQMARANKDLDVELELEAEEFFMDEGDALYQRAEELLEDFNEKPPAKVEVELTADEKADCDAWLDEVKAVVKAKQAVVKAEQNAQKAWAKIRGAAEVEVTVAEKVQKAWAKMDDEERAAMAALASAWQSR